MLKFVFFLAIVVNLSREKLLERPLDLWTLDVEGTRTTRNRRLDGVTGKFFLELKSSLSELPSILSKTSSINLPLSEEESLSCKISEGNRAVSSVLSEKFPSLHFYSGTCGEVTSGDIQQLELIFNSAEDQVDSFSATITSESRNFYIDSAERGSNKYVLYNTRTARREMIDNGHYHIEEKPLNNELKEPIKASYLKGFDVDKMAKKFAEIAVEKRKFQSSATGYIFKIEFLANQEYSGYHGATRDSVFAAMATLLSRVNGIYAREFGAFFQFSDAQDLGICLPGTQENEKRRRICKHVPNDFDIWIFGSSLLGWLGVDPSTYDLRHFLSTASGAVSSYPALCKPDERGSATGNSVPEGDIFAADSTAHEIGHQFFGAHSFRDCFGPKYQGNMLAGAVEPGGGTTIMSYSGRCYKNDIQQEQDPYFNSANLVAMYNYMLSVAEDGICGQSFQIDDPEKSLSPNIQVESTCTVPVGNAFQLNALGVSRKGFYSWDRVDPGFEDLDSKTLGRFRPYTPTKVVSRYFPNLHYLAYPETSNRDWEELPSIPRNMTMRFTERTLFSKTKIETEFSSGIVGQFQTADVQVEFVTSIDPLEVDFATMNSSATAGEPIHLTYVADSSVHQVEFYAANNDLNPVEVLHYETDVVELDWKFVGVGSGGVATIYIPKCLSGEIIIVARIGNEKCFYFDVITGITVSH
eukprot:snap_masked-scaffold_47-processed-gene-1.61-mRNA-1 protein AED:1.00 eAED:1.00 QI:0/-1/0/0/-1/1/1/0/695